jgi:hypothetical protein
VPTASESNCSTIGSGSGSSTDGISPMTFFMPIILRSSVELSRQDTASTHILAKKSRSPDTCSASSQEEVLLR